MAIKARPRPVALVEHQDICYRVQSMLVLHDWRAVLTVYIIFTCSGPTLCLVRGTIDPIERHLTYTVLICKHGGETVLCLHKP